MNGPVVVGFIRTPEGLAALAAATLEARRRTSCVVLVHSSKGGAEDHHDVVDDRFALEAEAERMREQGLTVDVEDLARGNDPADDLVEVADRLTASVIVIGMRRRSPVGKLLLGSNAQRLLLLANCPVLTVKADQV